MNRPRDFIQAEDGAATVQWVALTAGIVAIVLAMASLLERGAVGAGTTATDAMARIDMSGTFTLLGPAGADEGNYGAE
jgi:hypothetical protein